MIDARPRGPRGLLAAEVVLGKSMLDHLLEMAGELAPSAEPVVVHAREDERSRLTELASRFMARGVQFVYGPPRADAVVLRTDRFYDSRAAEARAASGSVAGIGRALAARPRRNARDRRRRADPPAVVSAAGKVLGISAGAAAWPSGFGPTSIRPNALTLATAGLMLSAAALIAAGATGWLAQLAIAFALALALVLDTADGRLARLQGTSSAFGRWLDQVLDELADMVLHAAIAWAAFCRDGGPGWLLLGILYASSKYLFQVQSLLGEELEGEMAAGDGSGRPNSRAAPR